MSKATHNFDSRAIVGAIVRGCDLATQRMILMIQNGIKISISGEGTGKKYPGGLRRSSRPGEPPAKQRGHLSRSWQVGKLTRVVAAPRVGWKVGSNVRYARILEFGGSRVQARPYVRPAIAKVEPDARKIAEAYIRDELRRLRMPPVPKA